MTGKDLRKIIQQLPFMSCILKKCKYVRLVFQKLLLSCSKKLSSLLRGITSKNNCNSCCLNCLPSFRTETKVKCREVCKIKIFVELLCQLKTKGNILKFNQYMKSDKTPCIIHADLESLIKKVDNCENNSEQLYKSK